MPLHGAKGVIGMATVHPEGTFIQRSLEENRFWLRIMKEHALFLSEGMNRRDTNLIATANNFFRQFDALLQEANQLEPRSRAEMSRFNNRSINMTFSFRRFKQDLLLQVILGRVAGFNFPLLIDHLRRAAEYFIATLTRLNEGIDEPIEASIVRENIFWLRIMADHSRFVRHLLDPSERALADAAQRFAHEFDQLLAQARDLESMTQGVSPVIIIVGGHLLDEVSLARFQGSEERRRERNEERRRRGDEEQETLIQPPPPVFARFNQDARQAAGEIRDFKRQGFQLILQARALSVIEPLLADHVAREAEKFLRVLDMLERRISQTFEPVQKISPTEPAPPCEPAR